LRWTQYERERIQEETIKILEANPTLTRHPALMQAQAKVLPEERRRKIEDWSVVKDWLTLPPHLAKQFNIHGQRTGAQPPQLAAARHNRSDGKPRVHWTRDEQAILARGAALALHQGVTRSRLQAFKLAQQDLPEHRRRNMQATGPGTLPWFDAALEKALSDIRAAQAKQAKLEEAAARKEKAREEQAAREQAEREAQALREQALQEWQQAAAVDPRVPATPSAVPPAPTVTVPTTPPAPAVPTVEPLAAVAFPSVPTVPTVPTAVVPAVASNSFGSLRGVLVDALAGIFREALVQAIQSIAPAPEPERLNHNALPDEVALAACEPRPAHDPRATNGKARAHRTSVLVAGIKGANQELIKAQFGHLLDLRFYSPDESKHQLKALASTADVSVAAIDFMGHSHTDTIKAHAARYIQSSGGMSTLRETLQTIVLTPHPAQVTNGATVGAQH
jgi:hypothetical protein